MPTYQYTCSACSEELEVVQKFTDDPLVACPACGGQLRKVFSPVGVVFKGSGFYRTDSREAQKNGKVNGQSRNGKDDRSGKDSEPSRPSTDGSTDSGSSGSGGSSGDGAKGSEGTKRSDSAGQSKVSDSNGSAKSGSGSKTSSAA